MKTFWIILLIAALAAVGLWMMRSGFLDDEDRLRAETDSIFDESLARPTTSTPRPDPAPPDLKALVEDLAPTTASATQPAPTTAAVAATQPQTQPAAVAVAATQPAVATPAASMPADAIRDGLDINIVAAEVEPGIIVPQADGTLRVDDRFNLPGTGTKEDPYRVTWEYLVSASETYQPRLGQIKMPQRIAMLHQKWVRIDGNIAFPLAATSPKEILCMLNMWDGCCIGIIPTPYDAIEVRLAEAAPASRRHTMTYGTVTGRLSVEPYLFETWLAGLYIMDEAVLEQGL